ncbi:hypothetical protein [Flavobacterium sp.]|uniref:hypothetical protein n=1 Tax=Flavobacterium sp. TaxID=239 RepID=UPI002489F1D5|nr:hypothetical protein [Flavobacterium sp.]MDI1316892.1 hypothetical protein [Flavobacterium sp.]
MSQEEIKIEKAKHKEYLAKGNFETELPDQLFYSNSIKVLKKIGHWLNALETGQIKPLTTEQNYFIDNKSLEKLSQYQLKKILTYKIIWGQYKKYHQDWSELYKILNKASVDEIETLSKILKLKTASKEQIIPELISNSKNLLEILDDNPSYTSILEKIKKKLKISDGIKIFQEIEKAIAIKVLEEALSKMTEEQKNKFEKEIIDIANKEKGITYKAGSVFAALTAAQVSGFGVYLLATTTLSTLSGIIGVTLPFAAYTGLSSAIGIIIGPVGWIGAGIFTLWKINDVNYNKIIPAVIYISWLREKYSS